MHIRHPYCLLSTLILNLLLPCDGYTIADIQVKVIDIFHSQQNYLPLRGLRKLKVNTKSEELLKILPVKIGQTCSTLALQETERRLRELKIFKTVLINSRIHENKVFLTIEVEDNWTISPRVALDSQNYQIEKFGVQDKNFLGLMKNVSVSFKRDELKTEYQLSYLDNLFLGKDLTAQILLVDRSDGERAGIKIEDQLSDLSKERGWGLEFLKSRTSIFKTVIKPNDFEFKKDLLVQEFSLAKQKRVGEGQWLQTIGGLRGRKVEFQDLESGNPFFDRNFLGPFFRASFLQPKFKTVDFFNFFDNLEDLDLGFSITAEVYYTPSLFDLSHSFNPILGFSKGFELSEENFFMLRGSFQTRLEEGWGFNNSVLNFASTFFTYFDDPFTSNVASFSFTKNVVFSENLDLDRQFTLGGDSGLVGYKNQSIIGENLVYFKAEYRNNFKNKILDLIAFGCSLFFEAGSSVNDFGDLTKPWLANLGFGMRFYLTNLSPPRVFRLDFGIPVRDHKDSSEFEIRLTIYEESPFQKSLFEERQDFDQFLNIGLID